MNRLIQLNKATAVFFVVLGLGCFWLSPLAPALSPPPDGGYPGANTAEGDGALQNLTTGINNTANGTGALTENTTGSHNTANGRDALHLNTSGDFNTASGLQALFRNTTGSDNTADGANALANNTGSNNTAIGASALQNNATGEHNTATGEEALRANTTGGANTANGFQALSENTSGIQNTATGSQALVNNTTGNANTANGFQALLNNTTGTYNTASGFRALISNTGDFNTAIGAGALLFNTAEENTATGAAALLNNTSGGFNTAAGSAALFKNTTGAHNTANGFQTLSNNTTGSDNLALGFLAGNNQTTGDNNIYIGSNILGVAGENNACYIASIFGQTSVNGIPVLINSDNKLGTATSSKRFKEDIKSMNQASEALFALKPVVFRYKKEIDPAGTSQFGLVAEDVEKANPNLIVRDTEGKPYSVRYDQVNAMLLNEFLKEHRKVQELEANAAKQQKQIAALSAGLQEVSAQVEMGKSVPQTVLKPATRRVGPDLTDQSPIEEVTTKHNRIVP
jgi:hypothetical protein